MDLDDVAGIYSAAIALGQPPTTAVANVLGISSGAAAQRVRRAREAGLLPATSPGRSAGLVPVGWIPV